MTRDEKSLLLYLETVVVDMSGIIDLRCVNQDDVNIMKTWDKSDFVKSMRVTRRKNDGSPILTYVVKLSDKAWRDAHRLRKERALRNIPPEYEVMDNER